MPTGTISKVRTADWEEAGQVVSGVYFPHELRTLPASKGLDLHLCTADLGPVTLGRMSWGTGVSIDCDYPEALEINIPLSGHLVSRHGSETVASGPGEGTVFPADTATPITCWTADCAVVGVKFARWAVERELDRVIGVSLTQPVNLPVQLKPDHAAVRSWLHMVRVLSAELPNMAGMLTNELVKAQVASAVLTGFLLAITPDERATAARPRIVKRVVDRLHEDPARAWTVADMAEIAGVSVRRLQEGFQEYLGTSPMAYLRDVRLTRIHEELSRHQRNSTIAEIAARWGFPHTGRFAAAYRRRYGVLPSKTREG